MEFSLPPTIFGQQSTRADSGYIGSPFSPRRSLAETAAVIDVSFALSPPPASVAAPSAAPSAAVVGAPIAPTLAFTSAAAVLPALPKSGPAAGPRARFPSFDSLPQMQALGVALQQVDLYDYRSAPSSAPSSPSAGFGKNFSHTQQQRAARKHGRVLRSPVRGLNSATDTPGIVFSFPATAALAASMMAASAVTFPAPTSGRGMSVLHRQYRSPRSAPASPGPVLTAAPAFDPAAFGAPVRSSPRARVSAATALFREQSSSSLGHGGSAMALSDGDFDPDDDEDGGNDGDDGLDPNDEPYEYGDELFASSHTAVAYGAFAAGPRSACSSPPAFVAQPPLRAPSKPRAVKSCACCGVTSTPLWRDIGGSLPLCNACGIRWKKYGLVCPSCQYVPCKQERDSKMCTRCSTTLPPASKRAKVLPSA